jgi:hypothetical protein
MEAQAKTPEVFSTFQIKKAGNPIMDSPLFYSRTRSPAKIEMRKRSNPVSTAGNHIVIIGQMIRFRMTLDLLRM